MKNPSWLLAFVLLRLTAAAQLPPPSTGPENMEQSVLTDEEKAAGWKMIFDGKNNQGLRGLTFNDFINRGWKIEHGTLFCVKEIKDMGNVTGGHLITAEQYLDFEFSFEWKLAVSGKSGILYFAAGTAAKPVGHIYSIIDDVHHPDGLKGGPIKRSGGLYGILPPSEDKKLNGPDKWNEGRIVVQGNHVEHWLNGAKVLDYTLGTPDFQKALIAYQKSLPPAELKTTQMLGRKFKTALVILDEGEEVEFRNLKIRPILPATAPGAVPVAR